MHKNLDHLTTDELEVFMGKYYTKSIPIKELFKEYQIHPNLVDIHKLFPPIILDTLCPYCKKPLQYERKSKLYHLQGYEEHEAYCPECQHRNTPFCQCDSCIREESKKREKKKREIFDHYSSINKKYSPISLKDLTLEQKLKYGAIFREFISEDLTKLHISLWTTSSPEKDMILEMMKNKILLIDPTSNPNHFDKELSPKMEEVSLIPNISDFQGLDAHKNMQDFISPSVLNEENYEELLRLWKGFCIDKCLEVFTRLLKHYSIAFNPEGKTQIIMEEMIEKLPVSKLSFLFHISVDKTIAKNQKFGFRKTDIAYQSLALCEKYLNDAISKSWNIYDREFPYNLFERFFFQHFLKIGNQGFMIVPSLIFFNPQTDDDDPSETTENIEEKSAEVSFNFPTI